MLIGYARVSTEDQNLDLQRDALRKAGCKKIFEEKESGRAGTKRPAFDAALAYLRPEDQLVVWKVDRLGRSLREMVNTAHDLQEQNVKVLSLTENIDTETATGRLMFNFLGTIAEYFLDLNRERTLEGRVANSGAGRRMGRTDPGFHTLLTSGRPKQSASSRFCSHTVQAPAKPKPLRSHSIASKP